MDKSIEGIYLREILIQANGAIRCANQFSELLKSSQQEFFRAVEHFLHHAAAISHLLFPAREKSKTRAEHLRKILNIDEQNALKDRTLRDHLVHFDERLDNWANNSKRKNFVDHCIGDIKKLVSGVDSTDYIRNFNPNNMEYIFLNETFNLNDILNAIIQIKNNIETNNLT
ncbi:TPA: hypothetical protein I8027_001776 [Legionella pneumophila]|nr:hypothetical protein [Legionella pneumophila]